MRTRTVESLTEELAERERTLDLVAARLGEASRDLAIARQLLSLYSQLHTETLWQHFCRVVRDWWG